MNIQLAVIENYDLIRYAFCHELRENGFDVVIEARNEDDFWKQIKTNQVPELCILSIDTPSIQEFTTAKSIRGQYPNMKIFAYTVHEENYKKIKEYGIDVFLPKSCSFDELKSHIQHHQVVNHSKTI